MAWTLDGLDLGYAQRESADKDANLLLVTIPTTGPSQSYTFDIAGASETITLEGVNVFASKANAQAWAGTGISPASTTLRGKITGNQSTVYTYSSDFYNSVSVKVSTINVTLEEGNPYTLVKYRIVMWVTGA